MKMFALFSMFIFLVTVSSRGEGLDRQKKVFVVPLQEMNTKSEIEGIEVNVKSRGSMTLTVVNTVLKVHADVVADLSDFQRKAGHIVRVALNEDEECDYSLNFSEVHLVPDKCSDDGLCKFAKMMLTGRYEEKVCILGREKSLLKQSFSCSVSLFPEIFQNRIRFQSYVSDLSAGGVLGKLMSLDILRNKIAELVNRQIMETAKTMESTMALTFPPELSQYKPRLNFVTFQNGGKDKLLLRATASATVPDEKAQELLDALKNEIDIRH